MAGRFEQRPTRVTVRGGVVGVPSARPGRGAVPPATGRTRVWAPDGPVDLGLVLGPLRRGPGDPTFRALADGSVWRACRTPAGPGTLRVAARGADVEGTAWGPGAEWLLDRLPVLLGAADRPEEFVPRHRIVAHAWRRRAGLRLVRTGLVMESLIPSVLEQKVTADEAYRAWRLLVRGFGEPAPGPAGEGDRAPLLHVPPAAGSWLRVPSWEWHRAGVDDKRAATILRAVRVAGRLEQAGALEPEAARRRLEVIPGVGPWTSAEVVQRSHGAADCVTVGDLHLPGIIGYALAGDRDADDAEMLRLLEPYAGQRHRAARLVLLSGRVPARRHPKMPRTDIGLL
ncbi:DNA-3-methyladenine glycosylase family protein [Streptomyces sp. NPDC127068]|uniref:DNA-3-methyladenine glycosylase family protein n=1 Tax=Streptomyces sp. NPDC127068 TaxID=3347127 RepID=UPI00364BBA26